MGNESPLVIRPAKLFEAGEYEDINFSATPEDLDVYVSNSSGTAVPLLIEHQPTPLKMGWVLNMRRKGKELLGELAFTEAAYKLALESGARKLSVGINPVMRLIEEVSLVRNPRVADAQWFSNDNDKRIVYVMGEIKMEDQKSVSVPESLIDKLFGAFKFEQKEKAEVTMSKDELSKLIAAEVASAVKQANIEFENRVEQLREKLDAEKSKSYDSMLEKIPPVFRAPLSRLAQANVTFSVDGSEVEVRNCAFELIEELAKRADILFSEVVPGSEKSEPPVAPIWNKLGLSESEQEIAKKYAKEDK